MKPITIFVTACMAVIFLSGCKKELDYDENYPVRNVTSKVTLSQAREIATHFHFSRNAAPEGGTRSSSSSVGVLRSSDSDTIGYVVNIENGGWVIVGASKSYYPVLAYSDRDDVTFPLIDNNPGFNIWVDEVKAELMNVTEFPDSMRAMISSEWMKYDAVLASSDPGLPGGNSPEGYHIHYSI